MDQCLLESKWQNQTHSIFPKTELQEHGLRVCESPFFTVHNASMRAELEVRKAFLPLRKRKFPKLHHDIR